MSIACDPDSLVNESKCFCFPTGQLQSVKAYLLCQIAAPAPSWTPSDEPTLLGWWKADSLSLSDGDPISSWSDSSSNGYTMTNTGSNRPTYKTGIKNNLPSVLFDDSLGQWLQSSMPSNTKPFTIAAVVQSPDYTLTQALFGTTANGDMAFQVSSPNWFMLTEQVAFIVTAGFTFVAGAWCIVILTYDGSGNWTVMSNGATVSGTNNTSFTGAGTTYMAQRSTGVSWRGYIGEIMKFSSVVDAATIDAYLNGKWVVY
jgi:hypothetical protein